MQPDYSKDDLRMIPYTLAKAVNMRINEQVQYTSDLAQYDSIEHWVEAVELGDCEDYALAKRAIFRQQGLGEHCHLATCWVGGVYHAVLIVDTEDGQYVLDNNHTFPMMKQDLNYKWHKIELSGQWHSLS